MESHGEQDTLAKHALEPSGEFDFRDCKRVSEMEGAIHVRIGEVAKPFFLAGRESIFYDSEDEHR